jgi:hypothetical protein
MNPKQLKVRFSYMFAGKNLGILFVRGWQPVFSQLCEEIDGMLGEDKRGFHWTQVKEKFGSARFYYSLGGQSQLRLDLQTPKGLISLVAGDDEPEGDAMPASDKQLKDLRARINDRVRAAEEQTMTRCVVCGAAASRRNLSGYLLVLCKEHERGARKGEATWELAEFREDE